MSSLNPYKENENLISRAQCGDEEARSKVYETNLGLVYMVLEKFKNTSYEYEDLFQVGSIGLLKAIDKFDFSFKVRFSTYAVPMIIGEIKKFMRDDGIVKVQRSLKETYNKVRWAQQKLRGELGREPGVDEIAELLGMDKENVVVSIEACQAPAYISDVLPSEENNNMSMLDRLTSSEGSAKMLEKIALREAIGVLDEREREVILRRYFKDETQACIAGYLGVSQVQVSRIEKTAVKKLKGILE